MDFILPVENRFGRYLAETYNTMICILAFDYEKNCKRFVKQVRHGDQTLCYLGSFQLIDTHKAFVCDHTIPTGDCISHPVYGKGTVVDALPGIDEADNAILKVLFENEMEGMRAMSRNHAPLNKKVVMKHSVQSNWVIVLLLLIWFCIFLTDIICAFRQSSPIFMLPLVGGDITTYLGLGYKITHIYGMTPDGYVDGVYSVQSPLLYIFLNIGGILWLLVKCEKESSN